MRCLKKWEKKCVLGYIKSVLSCISEDKDKDSICEITEKEFKKRGIGESTTGSFLRMINENLNLNEIDSIIKNELHEIESKKWISMVDSKDRGAKIYVEEMGEEIEDLSKETEANCEDEMNKRRYNSLILGVVYKIHLEKGCVMGVYNNCIDKKACITDLTYILSLQNKILNKYAKEYEHIWSPSNMCMNTMIVSEKTITGIESSYTNRELKLLNSAIESYKYSFKEATCKEECLKNKINELKKQDEYLGYTGVGKLKNSIEDSIIQKYLGFESKYRLQILSEEIQSSEATGLYNMAVFLQAWRTEVENGVQIETSITVYIGDKDKDIGQSMERRNQEIFNLFNSMLMHRKLLAIKQVTIMADFTDESSVKTIEIDVIENEGFMEIEMRVIGEGRVIGVIPARVAIGKEPRESFGRHSDSNTIMISLIALALCQSTGTEEGISELFSDEVIRTVQVVEEHRRSFGRVKVMKEGFRASQEVLDYARINRVRLNSDETLFIKNCGFKLVEKA